MKYIICLSAKKDTGKTCVINNVWDLLPSYSGEIIRCGAFYPGGKLRLNSDNSREIVGIIRPDIPPSKELKREKVVGVNSIGDSSKIVASGIVTMLALKADIIVCTSRSEKMLIDAINLIPHLKLEQKWRKYIKKEIDCELNDEMQQGFWEEVTNPESFTILTSGHFCLVDLVNGHKSYKYSTLPRPVKAGGVDISRISAQNIVELIERLK